MTSHPSHERPHDRDAELDLAGAIDVLVSQRWLIALVTAICVGAGTLYAFLAHRQYQADIMVQVEDSGDTSAAKSVLGDVSSLFDIKSSAAAEGARSSGAGAGAAGAGAGAAALGTGAFFDCDCCRRLV